MTLIVDASIVAKWIMDEDGSDRALALRNEPRLIAPSLIVSEVANALWKAVRRGEILEADAIAAVGVAFGPIDQFVPNEELGVRAIQLAILLEHPVYDCMYLALAEREDAPFITADRALIRAAKKLKGLNTRLL